MIKSRHRAVHQRAMSTGEKFCAGGVVSELVSFHAPWARATFEYQDRERDIARAQLAWQQARSFKIPKGFGCSDEINIALKYHYLDVEVVLMICVNAQPCSM